MMQKDTALTQAEVEAILKSTAVPLPAGSRMVKNPNGTTGKIERGDDASGSGLVTDPAALAAIP